VVCREWCTELVCSAFYAIDSSHACIAEWRTDSKASCGEGSFEGVSVSSFRSGSTTGFYVCEASFITTHGGSGVGY
jgi:hypothetical protein